MRICMILIAFIELASARRSCPLLFFVRSPGFGILSEGMLEDTLFNIIQEAYHGEFSITARPRLLALATAKDRQPVAGCEQSDD